jgi:hypothetical protein
VAAAPVPAAPGKAAKSALPHLRRALRRQLPKPAAAGEQASQGADVKDVVAKEARKAPKPTKPQSLPGLTKAAPSKTKAKAKKKGK